MTTATVHPRRHIANRVSLGRPRLVLSLIAGILVYAIDPAHADPVTRILIAWNVGTLVDIVLNMGMMARSTAHSIRWRAAVTDDGKWIILCLCAVAAVAALGAILLEIGIAKDLKGFGRSFHYAVAGSTILTAWVFIHLSFALHYAHQYFDRHKGLDGEKEILRGGLNFPGTDEPDYWDFLYFSFVIGVASQTADVSITAKSMRRLSLVHSILSFFFNSAVLALTINIAASLV